MTLQDRIDELVAQHGSLRAVARVTEIDVGYLSRLRAYANVNSRPRNAERICSPNPTHLERQTTMNNIFCTHSMHGTAIWQTIEAEPGKFYTDQLQFVPNVPYTAEQLAEIEADARMYAGYEDAFGGQAQPCDCYTTAEAAKRATEIHEMFSAIDDMHAFNAPSECYTLAASPLERELDELETRYRWVSPEERGLPDYAVEELRLRNRPIIEQWNPGSVPFDDIPF